MKISKKNAAIVRNVLDGWVKEGALTQQQNKCNFSTSGVWHAMHSSRP